MLKLKQNIPQASIRCKLNSNQEERLHIDIHAKETAEYLIDSKNAPAVSTNYLQSNYWDFQVAIARTNKRSSAADC